MKIALVTTDFLPNIGGVAQHVFEIAKALQNSADEVEVITIDSTTRWNDLRKPAYQDNGDSFSVWRIPFVVNRSIKFISGQLSSRVSSARFGRELLSRLHQLKPDVVHWHALNTTRNPMQLWRECATVWTNHTSHFIDSLGSAKGRAYAEQARCADEIITPSVELWELTASLGIDRDKIHFIPNGVDCARFHPAANGSAWRKALQVEPDRLIVLCPRRLEKKNGVSDFVRAANLLLRHHAARAIFVIAGDFVGPSSESEQQLVEQLISQSGYQESFHKLGRIENKDMPGLYACSDLIVIPSLMEATSLSGLEAMAAGKPIVATNVGGLPFLIRDGDNGILVQPRNPADLAEAIQRLLTSPDLRAKFGTHGRTRAEEDFDWKIIAQRTKEIYRAAIDRHRLSPRCSMQHAVA